MFAGGSLAQAEVTASAARVMRRPLIFPYPLLQNRVLLEHWRLDKAGRRRSYTTNIPAAVRPNAKSCISTVLEQPSSVSGLTFGCSLCNSPKHQQSARWFALCCTMTRLPVPRRTINSKKAAVPIKGSTRMYPNPRSGPSIAGTGSARSP